MKTDKKEKALLALYNLAQFSTMPLVLPALAAVCISRGKYRHQFLKRMGWVSPPASLDSRARPVWIHTMSLGEFNAARPLIKAIRGSFPGLKLVLSASTATGLSAISRSGLADEGFVTALPFDFLPVVARTVRVLRPACFLLVETDIWPNLLWFLKRQGTYSFLVNGSISEASARRLGRLPGAAGLIYSPFEFIGMQSGDDMARLLRLAVPSSRVRDCGNLKFDYVPSRITEDEKKRLFRATGFEPGAVIIAAGSTHPGEEKIIVEAFSALLGTIPLARLIIAPRDISRSGEVKKIIRAHGLGCETRSDYRPGTGKGHKVFLLDSLGELERFYSLSRVAFVGGSLVPVGGHNILEPAALGVPVIFGPYMESFRQTARMFQEAGAGFMVKNSREILKTLGALLEDEGRRKMACNAASSILKKNQGAVKRYLDMIRPYIETFR